MDGYGVRGSQKGRPATSVENVLQHNTDGHQFKCNESTYNALIPHGTVTSVVRGDHHHQLMILAHRHEQPREQCDEERPPTTTNFFDFAALLSHRATDFCPRLLYGRAKCRTPASVAPLWACFVSVHMRHPLGYHGRSLVEGFNSGRALPNSFQTQ
jgi:hypothetical protein